jgi:hypothetical protein
MGGREYTEVRALDPGRSSFSCLSLSLYFILSIIQLLVGGRNTQGKPVLSFGRGYEFEGPFPLT